jgi:beta-glucosidase
MKVNCRSFSKRALFVFAIAWFSIFQTSFKKKYDFPFQNPDLTFEERVNDLVSRLTLREKIDQMRNDAPAIPRLAIPKYNWWNECLHGVGRSNYNVTVFPQAIGLAASFDEDGLKKTAEIISDEARAINNHSKRIGHEGDQYSGLTFWTPNINIFRDPRWGRGQETYGEDPYLTSMMGMAMVHGLQGNDPKYLKVSACAKHYAVHSGPEAKRHVFDVSVSNYDLWDTYLPAFKKLVVDAKVSSVMCAYNRYAGQPCCGSDLLMMDILRNQWKFTGYVTSDCGGVEDFFRNHKTHPDAASATADAVLHGTDLECGGSYGALMDAVKNKQISEQQIDVSVKRLFMTRFRLGMFDPAEKVSYSHIPMSVVENKTNHQHALKMARESMVLLKNDAHTLPLNKSIGTIAIVGPNADDKNAVLGNYNGFPSKIVSVLDGIKAKVGPKTKVIYEKATGYSKADVFEQDDFSNQFSANDKGRWQVDYFANEQLQGTTVSTKTVNRIALDEDAIKALTQGAASKDFSARFTTVFSPLTPGDYVFKFSSERGYRFLIDEKKVMDQWHDHGNITNQYVLHAEAGKNYKLNLEYHQRSGKPSLSLTTGKMVRGDKNILVSKVKDADAIVFVGGISNAFEAEGSDKKSIDLPAIQTEYLKALQATGKPVIFVMFTGSAMSFDWEAKNIPAIVNAWYAGQDAGTAIADVLFGDYNPAGRLPVTFYKSAGDLPPLEDYSMANRTYRYFKGATLYPFGYGLSYTDFSYKWERKPLSSYTGNDTILCSVSVTNTGKINGDEVVQLYVQYPPGKGLPLQELKGFKRISISKNGAQKAAFVLPVSTLKKWNDTKNTEEVIRGVYKLYAGSNSEDKKLAVEFEIR